MVLAILDSNECNFAVKFSDESQKEKVKECMNDGLGAWYAATEPDEYEGDVFTKEEVESFYWAGYAEPTMELLDRYNIKYEIIDVEYDDEDCVTNADEVIWY